MGGKILTLPTERYIRLGEKRGIALGEKRGAKHGEKRMAMLTSCLIRDGRMDDLQAALVDEELCYKLYVAYVIE